MKLVKSLVGGAILSTLMATSAMAENTFKFAFQGTLKSLDPYSLNETFTLGTLGNVYEGLTRRGPDLKIEPALAESWEIVEPTRWRFKLRQGVKFHNGNDFNADDVIFSAERVKSEGSDLKTRFPDGTKFVKVDDYTVDVVLTAPNPILNAEWATWHMIDKEWAEANDSVKVTSASDQNASFISLNANGTGPFKLASHEAGVKTVFEANADWWNAGDKKHNLDKVEFSTIASDATRVAALLSGEMDMVYPIPVQDIKRVDSNPTTTALTGPELRTIFLGMDQTRDELLYSNIKGKNPFKDIKVRQAFYHAIDIEAIKAKVMRNLATPSAIMLSPFMFENAGQFSRLEYNPDGAKALLAEAGYPDGFEVGMDCPNDRYVNDEAICQAVVSMLAKVGVKVNLNAQPKAQYFAKVLASGGFDTSFYLLGWTPGSFDSWNVLTNLHGCRDEAGNGGLFNLGGYCNPKVDELSAKILSENDAATRLDMITQAYKMTTDEVAYIPLHQQGLAWGISNNVDLVQRADNEFMMYYANKK
ncbi:MAG: ABC transporter substrate-binding protein [Rhizobiaceae bacterium]|nr:ABC transporter substrate-binding protein [Rhizobiaceae bacterium]